uniref:Protein trichome birefringence-like 30 n=1 Tax=Noccaea caerulescens TaxID=107243 RepID=A0A1J3GFB1_NOCCA
MSPTHIRSSDWVVGGGSSKCEKETEPILLETSRRLDVGTNRRLYEIAVNVTKSTTKVPISFLDVTTMSEYRKDAHTSFYGSRSGKLMTPEQKSDPRTFADCYHWCLPGLPDTWNELLSLYIIYRA